MLLKRWQAMRQLARSVSFHRRGSLGAFGEDHSMADAGTLWPALGAAVGAALGVVAKSLWDRFAGWRSDIPLETWKIRTHQLERRLSEFYWPLYACLMRDNVVWPVVFYHLRPRHDREQPTWATRLPEEARLKLSQEIEAKALLPNHIDAVGIIRSSIHLANADAEFLALLAKYIRHVDAYTSLRSAGIRDADPIDVDEPFPAGLSEAVEARLQRYQAEYEELLRDKGVADFRKTAVTEVLGGLRPHRLQRCRNLDLCSTCRSGPDRFCDHQPRKRRQIVVSMGETR